MRLSFYGAAGEVTGSCYYLRTASARVLIDFGLHQGYIEAEKKNRRLPPIDFAGLDAVVLTHAHLDHVGRMPLLGRAGYPAKGRIWATPATMGLTDLLLKDAASIMEMDAERVCDRRKRICRPPVEPLFTTSDVEEVLPRFSPIRYNQLQEIAPGVTIRMVDAGHIIGSASVEMTIREGSATKVIAFSGDIGERGSPLLKDPTPLPRCDVMLLESTYGDRDHRSLAETIDEFAGLLNGAAAANGTGGGRSGSKMLIPAFAVGRTQELVYVMGDLVRGKKVAHTPVYVDSPMAVEATELYRAHRDLWDDEAWAILNSNNHPLSFPGLRYTRSADESRALNQLRGPGVIISAAGMCTGGRILHHLRHHLWKKETCVVFVGYQAQGTLGRRLVDGAKEVRIMGEPVSVQASIHTLGGFSAHAGQNGLCEWAGAAKDAKPRVFLTHGEDGPRNVLREQLQSRYGLSAALPVWGETVEI